MQSFNGTYTWHYINNENKIEGIKEGSQYLICIENTNGKKAIWKMQLAYWFNKGDELTIRGHDGESHYFCISSDGFYVVDDFKGKRIYQLFGVRYWTTIMQPEVSPDEVLTIL